MALYGLPSENLGVSYQTLLVPIIGIAVSVMWYLILKSPADLNRIKPSLAFVKSSNVCQHAPTQYEWHLAEEGQGKTYRAW